ncbi:MAG: hypothetical protein ACOVQ6_16175, partial [Brevundimonas sp.]
MVWVRWDDVDQPLRRIRLRNGREAILCACYDGFGLRASVDPRFADGSSIRWILDRDISDPTHQAIRWFYASERG